MGHLDDNSTCNDEDGLPSASTRWSRNATTGSAGTSHPRINHVNVRTYVRTYSLKFLPYSVLELQRILISITYDDYKRIID
jgi:hypothetical protein